MTAADGILAIIGAGVVAYTVLGGADFGGGAWDLFARGPRRQAQRDLIATTMGPVWEANHVWLVFVLIGLFSGFPLAFGQLSRMLAVPLGIALLGIVLRGSAFVFRQYGGAQPGSSTEPAVRGTAAWGRVFAIASTATPAMLGLCAGAVATGRLGGVFPPVAGLLALTFCTYLAAVFLCQEARRLDRADLADDFRRRGVAAAVVSGALAVLAVPVLAFDAPDLAGRLTDRALPLLIASACGGVGSIVALLVRRFVLARAAATMAVASVVAGWAVATYPVILPPDLTVDQAAAPGQTLPVTLAVLVVGFAVTVPALILLWHTFSRPPTTGNS
jgi:cytochrome d ubiquinol oxidase subunit II